ncbi:MAG: RagB/SusD family nutrient uptake outer membrane protein [Thermoflavifilum aggregans]|nr:RagB/SusD family nutrient uptake outer membrane protein [Thermoflavifilum aggregans]
MKRIFNLVIIIIIVQFISACTKLDEQPFDVLASSNYYQDKKSLTAAILRPYEHGQWCGWDGDRWLISELTADQFVWTQKGKHGYDGGDWMRLHYHQWTPDDSHIYGGWAGPYEGIAQCNILLQDINKLDYAKFGLTDQDKKHHIAEIRVLRAWFYLFLLDYFRKVPIITQPGELKPASSAQELSDFIEKELKESIPDLPKNGPVGRWDQGGAAALLVRLYLNSEVWTGQARYNECAQVAQDIINGKYGTYELDSDYRGPFRSGINGYRSPENIFEFPHAKNIYEFGFMYYSMMHYQSRYSMDNNYGAWNGIHLQPSRDLDGNVYQFSSHLGTPYEKFSDDDYRKQSFRTTGKGVQYDGFFLVGPQFYFDYTKGYGFDSTKPVLGTEEYNGKPLIFVDQVGRFSEKPGGRWTEGSHVADGEENSGVRLVKFPWLPMSEDLFMFNSAPEIRLAEIYFALAECKYRSGDKPGAAALLDAVEKRNFPDSVWPQHSYVLHPDKLTDDEFVDALGREFIGERHRRTDLVRWHRFGLSWWDKDPDGQDKSVFPIPSRALNTNPLLEPNGY